MEEKKVEAASSSGGAEDNGNEEESKNTDRRQKPAKPGNQMPEPEKESHPRQTHTTHGCCSKTRKRDRTRFPIRIQYLFTVFAAVKGSGFNTADNERCKCAIHALLFLSHGHKFIVD